MRNSIYAKFEALIAEIKNMVKKHPYIGWSYEKTDLSYFDNLEVVFYFRDIRYKDKDEIVGINITDSTTFTDISAFVFRCEELIMAEFCFEKINVNSLYPNIMPVKHDHDKIDSLRYFKEFSKACEEKLGVIRQKCESQKREKQIPDIKKVIFNKPATIVFWADGTKTVVKAQGKERYDKEKGLAMAIAKKALGNEGSYYDAFKEFLD